MKFTYFRICSVALIFICSIFLISASYAAASETCLSYAPEWYINNPTSKVFYSGASGDEYFTLQNRQQANILQTLPFFSGCENHDGYLFSYSPFRILLPNNVTLPLPNKDISYIQGKGVSKTFGPYTNTTQSLFKEGEDLIIESIAQNGKMTFRTDNFPGMYPPVDIDIPASNCVKVDGGSGPHKIIFVLGKNLNVTSPEVVAILKTVIDDFKKTQPFKKYSDQFSFYIDLKKVDETNLATIPLVTNSGLKYYTPGSSAGIKDKSSCKGFDGISSESGQYIFFFNNPSIYLAWTTLNNFMFLNAANGGASAETVIHEYAHSFAGILDEYDSASSLSDFLAHLVSDKAIALNCSTNPIVDFRDESTNTTYFLTGTVGCNGKNTFTDSSGKLKNYYRSASNSIMRESNKFKEFSVIHCGYIIATIKGERPASDQILYKKNASKYWSECKQMGGTIFEGGYVNESAKVTGVNASGNNTFTISGSSFTPTNNAVKLTHVGSLALQSNSLFGSANALWGFRNFFDGIKGIFSKNTNTAAVINAVAPTVGQIYDIPGIASSNGTSLTFTTPTEVPSGKYKVSVGAFNSSWTDTNLTISVTSGGVVVPPTDPDGPVVPPAAGRAPTLEITNTTPTSIRLKMTSYFWHTPVGKKQVINYPTFNVFDTAGNLLKEGLVGNSPVVGGEPKQVYSQYTMNDLQPLTRYCYIVSARAEAGVSPKTEPVCATTTKSPTVLPPAAERLLGPTLLGADTTKKGQITISWAHNGNGLLPHGFSIYRSNGKSGVGMNYVNVAELTGVGAPYGTSPYNYADTSVSPSTIYNYRIYSAGYGTEVVGGGYIDAKSPAALLKPSLTISSSRLTQELTLSSKDTEVTYTVVSGKKAYLPTETIPLNLILGSNISDSKFEVTGLNPNTEYCYTIYTASGGWRSASSGVVCEKTLPDMVTVIKVGSGTGTVTGGGINCGTKCSVPANPTVSIIFTATPSVTSIFSGWSGICSGTGTCTIPVNQNNSVTATFTSARTINIAPKGTNKGTGTISANGIECGAKCSLKFPTGLPVTLVATPAADSMFTGWSGVGCVGTLGNCVITLSPNADATMAAGFGKK